ncbi:MAG: hypothetical protein ACF8MF_08950 [Phycisphaerales bacterium JB052]
MNPTTIWPLLQLGAGLFLLLTTFMLCVVLWQRRRVCRKLPEPPPRRPGQIPMVIGLAVIGFVIGVGTIVLTFRSAPSGGTTSPLKNPYTLWSVGALTCAGLVGVLWLVGDRSYGRPRCPRCWYDLSARSSKACPECGREVRSESRLFKTRRRKILLILALGAALPAGLVFMQSNRLAAYGWAGIVPDRVLAMGWRVLPEDWVIQTNAPGVRANQDLSLESRIERAIVTDELAIALGEKLVEPLLDSPEARWDPRRGRLLSAVQQRFAHTLWGGGGQRTAVIRWFPETIDLDELVRVVHEEVVDALIAVEHDRASELQLRIYDQLWAPNLRWVIDEWFAYRAIDQGQMGIEEHLSTRRTAELISAQLKTAELLLDSVPFQRCLLSDDDTIVLFSLMELYDRSELDQAFDWYRERIEQADAPVPAPLSNRLPSFTQSIEDETRDRFVRDLERWSTGSNPHQRRFVIAFCARAELQRVVEDMTEAALFADPAYQAALDHACELIMRPETVIGEQEVQLAAYAAPDGRLLCPIAARLIAEGQADALSSTRVWSDSLRRTMDSGLWVEHLSPVLHQADPATVKWFLRLLPRVVEAKDYATIVADLEAIERREDDTELRRLAAIARNRLPNPE